jgi:hypothetical protein
MCCTGRHPGIPAACGGSGTCGLCRVTVTGEGAGEPQATERGILSAKERRDHVRLACQTSLRGDCASQCRRHVLAGGGFEGTVRRPDAGAAHPRNRAGRCRWSAGRLPRRRVHADHRAALYAGFRRHRRPEAFREAWESPGWDRSRRLRGARDARLFARQPAQDRGGRLQHPPRRAARGPRGRGAARRRVVLALLVARATGRRVGPVRGVPRAATPTARWSSSAAASAWHRCGR